MKTVKSSMFGSCIPTAKVAMIECARPGFENFEIIAFNVDACMFDDMIGASSCRNVTEDGRDASLVEV